MLCRYCHKKIPAFYAWLVSAEFCCEAHAKFYKDAVLARLSTDPGERPVRQAAPPAATVVELKPEARVERAQRPAPEPPAEIQRPPDEAPVLVETSDIDTEELWRLADQVGGIAGPEIPEASASTGAVPPPPPGKRKAKSRKGRAGMRRGRR
jgi:hypothetical protein